MRWSRLFILTLLLGSCQMFFGKYFQLPRLPLELLFLAGFHSALNCRAEYCLPAMWWCGLVHDLFLGSRLGTSIILFSLCAIFIYRFRNKQGVDNTLARFVLGLTLMLPVIILRPLLDNQSIHYLFNTGFFRLAIESAVFSMAASPLLRRIISKPLFRTWKVSVS